MIENKQTKQKNQNQKPNNWPYHETRKISFQKREIKSIKAVNMRWEDD